MSTFSKDVVLLSAYPQPKVIVECDRCGMRAKYDKLEMLEVGGDRPLPGLLVEVARRKGCEKLDSISVYDRCRLRYANILPEPNTYSKARDG